MSSSDEATFIGIAGRCCRRTAYLKNQDRRTRFTTARASEAVMSGRAMRA